MSDLRLDTTTHDLVINNFNFELTNDDDEDVAQRLKIRLLFFFGEWFLNTNFGVPYYQDILKKQADETLVDAIFRTHILQTPGVNSLLQYESSFDASLRKFDVEFKVKTDSLSELELLFSVGV